MYLPEFLKPHLIAALGCYEETPAEFPISYATAKNPYGKKTYLGFSPSLARELIKSLFMDNLYIDDEYLADIHTIVHQYRDLAIYSIKNEEPISDDFSPDNEIASLTATILHIEKYCSDNCIALSSKNTD